MPFVGAVTKTKKWFMTSVWLFPLAILVIIITLSALRISGSSIGYYHHILYGNQSKDSSLLYGQPRSIRSDEFLIGTQEIVGQSKSGFPKVDPYMDHNVILQTEVPSKDWSAVFRPQNWSFFILPIENAFAFKWWLIMGMLMVSSYFFVLRLLAGKRLLGAIFSVATGLTPFALWWYQTSVFAGLAYGFWMIVLGVRIINREGIPFIKNQMVADTLQLLALAFIITCFGLILYPPFQIPIAITVLAYLIGYLLNKCLNDKLSYIYLLKRVGLMLLPVLCAGALAVIFIIGNRSIIDSLNSTVYPGHRIVSSGGLAPLKVFDGFLMPLEQSMTRSTHFFANQSEASNFILLMPFLLLPGFILMACTYLKYRRIDWAFLAIQLVGIMFLLRSFVPYGNGFYHLLLLDRVPNFRLVIGMGFVGVIQFIYIAKELVELRSKQDRWRSYMAVLLYCLVCWIALLLVGNYVRQHYPLFAHNWLLLAGLAGAFIAIALALLVNRPVIAASLLLIFTLASSFKIIPLYQGLGFASHNAVATAMDRVSGPKATWVTVDNIYFENMGLLAGRTYIGGAQIYPDLDLWRQIGGKKYDYIYNREGHAIFTTDPSLQAPMKLVQFDAYDIKFDCSPFIKKNVDFALATHPLNLPCVQPVGTVPYPALTFYLYRMTS